MKRLLLALLFLFSVAALAQGTANWPSAKPITLIVPYPPGGNVDYGARLLAGKLRESLRQTVIVENVAGAGGVIGVTRAVQAAPDGYTLVMGADSPISIARLITPSTVPYDGLKDLAPVALVNSGPMMLVARPGLQVQNFSELVKLARAQPGKLNYGTSGVGTILHLAMERVKQQAKIDVVHVPYKGGAQAMNEILGDQLDLAMLVAVSTVPQVRTGKIKGIGVTSRERLPSAPDVPALAEVPELKGFDMEVWIGVFAPAKTPAPIVERLNREITEAINSPDLRAKFEEQGARPGKGSAADFAAFLQREQASYERIVRAAGIKE
jgi:tripartite-type tricarboxylate transporter receptor subunit TctC